MEKAYVIIHHYYICGSARAQMRIECIALTEESRDKKLEELRGPCGDDSWNSVEEIEVVR